MKAIIMAGGYGTRLRPLTCSVPKPLAKLCGRPVVHYILDLLNEHGCTDAVFTLGYKGGQIEELFETGRYKNINLAFSYEDTPLGTAGCVRKAAKNFDRDSDFVVISGDALCDFDLSAALASHKKARAGATIITKAVDDPREYGLVISDSGGFVTGFSEKPSFLGCISDRANTGVYVISPRILPRIPDNTQCDFARDVFPQMLAEAEPILAHDEQGYWCDIGDFTTYIRSQHDILRGKVRCYIDESRKVGTNYVGKNVSIGAGSSLNACIIGDNVNIGSNVKLRGAVVLESAFISDGATVNNAIICPGAKLQHSASVYEGSVIGDGAVIGREAIVANGARVWNERQVKPGANITRDVKYAPLSATPASANQEEAAQLADSGISGQTNIDITPEFAARLGAALATVAAGYASTSAATLAISCEANNASKAMKYAIIAGASGAGAEVFDIGAATRPQLLYAANLLDCGIVARVKSGASSLIEVMTVGGLGLSRTDERKLEAGLSRSEFKSAAHNDFGAVHEVAGLDDMYTAMLRSHAAFRSAYRLKVNCNSSNAEALSKLLTPVFGRVSNPDESSELLIVTLTDGGSGAELYTEKDVKVSYEQLLLLGAAAHMAKGNDVALPNDFAACADYLAGKSGRSVHRYFLCPNDNSDKHARELAEKQVFLRDGAVLALTVLEYLSRTSQRIEEALAALPNFASVRREIEINCPPQRVISRLCGLGSGRGEGVILGNRRENVFVRSSKRGNSLYLYAQSLSAETAGELCAKAEELVKNIIKDNI
ncbi:MAG: sugar phosphate nucleotidyltransferase [Oscillospiraceae bacterium]|nr:sugar phosphate nucleotidyltransferase [Oscillospiraceae bacterium]